MGDKPFSALRLLSGNYIDAMAMISKEAWSYVGGYATHRLGWQDYDFWCRLLEVGLHGVHVDEVLALYRVHQKSMLRTTTNRRNNKVDLLDMMGRTITLGWPLLQTSGHNIISAHQIATLI